MAMRTPYTLAEGDEVYGSDGEKLGKAVAADQNYVVVEKGWFFPTDYYIPISAISSYADGKATLNVTKDVALNQGWDTTPAVYTTTTDETVSAAAPATMVEDEVVSAAPAGLAAADPAPLAPALDTQRDVTAATADDTLTVPVYEEELVATTHRHEVGGARVEKSVESAEQSLDVPVTEERLTVVRRPVDRDVSAADANQAFEDVIVDVPLTREEVEVGTQARVAEEIVIQREDVAHTEHVSGTVRRERVEVTEDFDGAIAPDDRDQTR